MDSGYLYGLSWHGGDTLGLNEEERKGPLVFCQRLVVVFNKMGKASGVAGFGVCVCVYQELSSEQCGSEAPRRDVWQESGDGSRGRVNGWRHVETWHHQGVTPEAVRVEKEEPRALLL